MWEYSLECGSFPFLVPVDLVLNAIMLYNFIIIIEDSDFSFKLKIDGQKKKKRERMLLVEIPRYRASKSAYLKSTGGPMNWILCQNHSQYALYFIRNF